MTIQTWSDHGARSYSQLIFMLPATSPAAA
jgi:hypothetical protein